jgi:Do/DeqQ family serine protease
VGIEGATGDGHEDGAAIEIEMRRTWLIFSQAVTVAVAVLFVVATLKPQWLQRASDAQILPSVVSLPVPAAGTAPASYAAAAKRASPAVVSIAASKASKRNPHANDPWFRFFFGGKGTPDANPAPQVGLGSGVIVSQQGYLVTNNHVIEGASDIEVQLADGRQAKAKLVGADPETDVAVLKVELDRLPVIGLGDAGNLQVGDVVLAIGNPFNVGQTVTSGIVSALGRNQLGINTFENFIQTDAAINPGNSGGALVDVYGNLVGINTAIFSRSGGSLGIGFAIPVDTARQVMEGLIREGQVVRGWIGVEPRDLTPEFAENFRLPVKEGVLITGVLQDGPASKGGLRPGDVVLKVGDRSVINTVQLLNAVAALKPKTDAMIRVQRGDKALDLKVRVAQRPAPPPREAGADDEEE